MTDAEHAGPEATSPVPPPEQYSAPFAVSISFPESVVIKMVDATALNDYEVNIFLSSLFFSVFIGFVVTMLSLRTALAQMYAAFKPLKEMYWIVKYSLISCVWMAVYISMRNLTGL